MNIEKYKYALNTNKAVAGLHQLYYPNQAVVLSPGLAPTDGYSWSYWTINNNEVTSVLYKDDVNDNNNRRAQNMFLNKEDCKNAKDVDDTHNFFLGVIIQINHDYDYSRGHDCNAYVLYWDHDNDCKGSSFAHLSHWADIAAIKMCSDARRYMESDEVSDDEFKKFLKMYGDC